MTPDEIKVPLDRFVREVAQEAARTVIEEHIKSCAVAKRVDDVESDQKELFRRQTKLEISWARFVGLLLGAAGLGGITGGLAANASRLVALVGG